LSEKTNGLDEKQANELPPLDFEKGPGAALVLGEMGITEKDEFLLVSCKVEQLTVEAKVRPADYEQARGYASLVPQNLWVHVPIHDPARKVNESGNVEILGAVFRYVARELDLAVFEVASERVDRKVVLADARAQKKGGVNAGTAIQPSKTVL
jgi:hypothetical protein